MNQSYSKLNHARAITNIMAACSVRWFEAKALGKIVPEWSKHRLETIKWVLRLQGSSEDLIKDAKHTVDMLGAWDTKTVIKSNLTLIGKEHYQFLAFCLLTLFQSNPIDNFQERFDLEHLELVLFFTGVSKAEMHTLLYASKSAVEYSQIIEKLYSKVNL